MKTTHTSAATASDPAVPFLAGSMQEKTIIEVFEQQVLKFPGKAAVVSGGQTVTYRELNEQANRLAAYLREAGVQRDTSVVICLEQSPEKLVCIIAILKAGGAYIPIDPNYPEARISFLVEDTQAPFLLTTTPLTAKLKGYTGHVIHIDSEDIKKELAIQSKENPATITTGTDLAYIIYTSGSTGNPKGVMIEHRSLYAFTKHHSKALGITANNKTLQFSSTSFDAAVIDLWIPLLNGATLYLYPNNRIIGAPLLDFIRQQEIDILPLISPTVLASFPMGADTGKLAVIGIGGEACPAHILCYWAAKLKLLNSYGPTEATVAVTSFVCNETYPARTIGKAMPGATLYILDKQMNEVEDSEAGELFIGGIQVARGYLNRPETNVEKFIPNPFAVSNNDAPDRLYRTGDLVRRLPDGNLEFTGRIDDQVKIRGYRIEPGETEQALNILPGVKQAVVLPREDNYGNTLLAAFIIPETALPEDTISLVQKWRQQLMETLPAYMVPDRFEFPGKMPVNAHGKVDKEKLQLSVIAENDHEETDENIAPENYESAISKVWSKYLPHAVVSYEDDFFSLGGHSLLLMQVYEALPKLFHRYIHIPDLYAYPTIHSLANEIRAQQAAAIPTEKEKEQTVIQELLQDARLNLAFHITGTPDPEVLINPPIYFPHRGHRLCGSARACRVAGTDKCNYLLPGARSRRSKSDGTSPANVYKIPSAMGYRLGAQDYPGNRRPRVAHVWPGAKTI